MRSTRAYVLFCLFAFGVAMTVAFASPAEAQDRTGTVEISPFGGGYFGGRLYAGTNAIFSRDVDIGTAPTFGMRVGMNVNRWFGIEAGYAHAEPDIKARGSDVLFGSTAKLGELTVNQYDLNAVFNMGKKRVIPYITIGAGATTLRAKVPDVASSTDTRFAANIGLGIKAFFTPNVGLRFDGRARGTYLNRNRNCTSGTAFCDDRFRDDSDRRWLGSGEVTGGLTVAF